MSLPVVQQFLQEFRPNHCCRNSLFGINFISKTLRSASPLYTGSNCVTCELPYTTGLKGMVFALEVSADDIEHATLNTGPLKGTLHHQNQ